MRCRGEDYLNISCSQQLNEPPGSRHGGAERRAARRSSRSAVTTRQDAEAAASEATSATIASSPDPGAVTTRTSRRDIGQRRRRRPRLPLEHQHPGGGRGQAAGHAAPPGRRARPVPRPTGRAAARRPPGRATSRRPWRPSRSRRRPRPWTRCERWGHPLTFGLLMLICTPRKLTAWQTRSSPDRFTGCGSGRSGPLILELDLTDGIAEGPPQDPVPALLTMRRTRLPDVLEGLKRASADDRVRALVVKVGGARIGLAKIQELRDAVTRLPAVGQAHGGVGRDVRRLRPRQRAVLPGHRVRPDLPAAVWHARADRRRRRAGLPARRAGQARHRLRVAPSATSTSRPPTS